jgi:hypothetical protein
MRTANQNRPDLDDPGIPYPPGPVPTPRYGVDHRDVLCIGTLHAKAEVRDATKMQTTQVVDLLLHRKQREVSVPIVKLFRDKIH